MGRILDTFVKQLPAVQSKYIEQQLQRSRERREIRTPQQLRDEFQLQLRKLLEQDFPLRFEPPAIVGGTRRSSELIEGLISLIADDLMALFGEAAIIADLADRQDVLYEDEIIARLRRAVDEATRELDRIETIYGSPHKFSEAIVEKFRIASSRLSRRDNFARDIYVDPKLERALGPETDMPVDVNLGALTLPSRTESSVVFSAIADLQSGDIRSANERFGLPTTVEPSTVSELDPDSDGRILHVIDRSLNTFWIKRVNTNYILDEGCRLTLKLTIGQPREINYVEVQPFGVHPTELSELYYIDDMDIARRIEIGAIPPIIKEPTRIFFKSVFASAFFIMFTQRSPDAIVIGQGPVAPQTHRYTFGLDNILAGKIDYADVGCYVSRTLSAPQIRTIFLAATENTNLGYSQADELSPISDPIPLIEYWIHFRELDSSGNVVYSKFLPILPSGVSLQRELVVPDHTGRAKLNFAIDEDMDLVDHDADDLTLYRNGVEILRPNDYRIQSSDEVTVKSSVLNINGGFNEQKQYIAEYMPLHIKDIAPVEFTDATGLIRYNQDSTITINRPSGSRAVESQVNLLIIMRNVSGNVHTAAIDQFTLGIA